MWKREGSRYMVSGTVQAAAVWSRALLPKYSELEGARERRSQEETWNVCGQVFAASGPCVGAV